jgi:hypothetical protein
LIAPTREPTLTVGDRNVPATVPALTAEAA